MTNKVGIIVDGHGDYLSIKKRFPRTIVLKTSGPRGHNAIPSQIVKSLKKEIALLEGLKCNKAILLLDFEDRTINYQSFMNSLNNTISSASFNIPVKGVSPNKMIENWYLADICILSKKKSYLKDNLKQKSYEGKHGKNELKKFFKKTTHYKETKHGPELFKTIRLDIAKTNSNSLKEFLIQV